MARALRLVAVMVVAVAVVVVPATPAAAGIGLSTSLSLPTPVTVGQTARAGSFLVRNTNTPPNNTESNTVTQLRLVLSCGTTGTIANPCPMPDTGVFSVNLTASGRTGTACAGRMFTVSAPDAIGAVTFIVQGAPLTIAVGGECVVDFTFNVLKIPTIDASAPDAGPQTRANLLVTVQGSVSGVPVSSMPTLLVTVLKAFPTVTTLASRNLATGAISDTATVAGVAGVAAPTGTVTFRVYGPNDAVCSNPVLASSTNAVSGGTATSDVFPTTQVGTYRFVATYNGDANYLSSAGLCNEPGETVVVTRRAVADFDGNGTTDRSVYRNGGWYVQGQATVFFGLAGDIPVPADYDGNGTTDRAVFKDGAWYVQGQPTVFFGLAGDVPVPGDYDASGDFERAVFRPSTGAWYVEGLPTVFLGGSGDIPVPGDYDGDGDTDRGVYRDGAWYVEGQATVFLGQPGYIPVPGDYDGNRTTDRAVYTAGGWYVQGQPTVFFGLAGHVPEPGDYDGDGDSDRAVYAGGGWYVQGQSTVFFGVASDVPLPLPQAIYRRFF